MTGVKKLGRNKTTEEPPYSLAEPLYGDQTETIQSKSDYACFWVVSPCHYVHFGNVANILAARLLVFTTAVAFLFNKILILTRSKGDTTVILDKQTRVLYRSS